jgi:glycine/D-amino acid oxidase-like deaminating enzyme
MGSSVALFLARQGFQVTLFDRARQPFDGASGWNQGRINLGYLYAADSSLGTARQFLAGGLLFRDIVQELLGGPLAGVTTTDEVFLLHRDSVVSHAAIDTYFRRVTELVRGHPDAGRYLDDAARRGATPIGVKELAGGATQEGGAIAAAWRIPERSVSSRWLARRFIAAIAAEPRIELRMGLRIDAVRAPEAGALEGPFRIATEAGEDGPYTIVVNALWDGRCLIDQGLGLAPAPEISHRYRYALFAHTARPVPQDSAVIGTGPFGEVKAYGERDFCLSWYPASLAAEGQDPAPPPVPSLDDAAREALVSRIVDGLAEHLPAIRQVVDQAASLDLHGGWIFAQSRGSLSDPSASIHRRDRFGIRRSGRYVSVDTGQFSTAPWMAREIAAMFRSG